MQENKNAAAVGCCSTPQPAQVTSPPYTAAILRHKHIIRDFVRIHKGLSQNNACRVLFASSHFSYVNSPCVALSSQCTCTAFCFPKAAREEWQLPPLPRRRKFCPHLSKLRPGPSCPGLFLPFAVFFSSIFQFLRLRCNPRRSMID